MKNLFMYSYNPGSEGAKNLAAALGIKRIKHKGSKFKGSRDKTVINWGSTDTPEQVNLCTILNKPEAVQRVSNKLKFFQDMKGLDEPWMLEWTVDRNIVAAWIDNGGIAVCRTILNGHSGAGIVLATTHAELVDAKLYTLYVPKKDEYRVHVFDGEIIDIQQKARKNDVPDEKINWQIRNHDNGFIYKREGVECPEVVKEAALDVMGSIELDFGAVDIIFNHKKNRAYVLEVNSAPGLEGQTIENYTQAIIKWMEN